MTCQRGRRVRIDDLVAWTQLLKLQQAVAKYEYLERLPVTYSIETQGSVIVCQRGNRLRILLIVEKLYELVLDRNSCEEFELVLIQS